MYDDGYSEIVNIDISDEVIKQMNELAIKKNKKMICILIYKKIFFFIEKNNEFFS